MPPLSSAQKALVAQFVAITGTNDKVAQRQHYALYLPGIFDRLPRIPSKARRNPSTALSPKVNLVL
ncbi:hypothetical protein VMCG_00213 [Cytospora schulzeri]|uniref:Uncharacterized protein n=1 Tax=Cytospora schulzeri TaxID=448051 RepID=A0A423XA05_9PEZI|nr:hypothetical protein VMCG_00213 [Valsa malicola]